MVRAMAVSAVQRSKRALVSLLKTLASKHSLDLDVNRDSGDAEVRKSYRTLSRMPRMSLRQSSMPFAMCAGRLRERRVLHQGHDS